MRGKKAKENRLNRVAARIVIERLASGETGVRQMPSNERTASQMMGVAIQQMKVYFAEKAAKAAGKI